MWMGSGGYAWSGEYWLEAGGGYGLFFEMVGYAQNGRIYLAMDGY